MIGFGEQQHMCATSDNNTAGSVDCSLVQVFYIAIMEVHYVNMT